MELVVSHVIKKSIPLCFISDDKLLMAKSNKLFIYNLETKQEQFIVSLPISFFRKQLSKNNLIFRLLRLGVRMALPIESEKILVVFENYFFELDLQTQNIKKTFHILRGNRPLNITRISGVANFEDSLYFGEYFVNFKKLPVHIYKRNVEGDWDIVWTFPEGTIEHVHNIVPDPSNNCVWILVGDFDNAAGIWRATDNFKVMEPVLKGKQIYRACVAFPTKEGLLYATDSQYEKNSLRMLKNKPEGWVSEHVADLNGPVIYGGKVNDLFFFSTSVEGDSLSKGRIGRYFDKEPGPGLLSNEAVIVGGNVDLGFENLYKNKKDVYPFFLFQFGGIIFPFGENKSKYLVTYNMALNKNNLHTTVFNIK